MPESVAEPLMETLRSGWIGQGPKVTGFERDLSEYIGAEFPVTVNSATSGLQLALRLAEVKPGDEVITTPMTCTATNMPILAMHANIVWADIDPVSGNIDPEDIVRKITPNTQAIMVVHWGGYPCDLVRINEIARDNGIKVIEDAAHAFGSEYQGNKIGTHSDYVVFSFQAIKHMTTVDGGVLFCKSEHDYRRAKLLRWYGIDRESNREDFCCEENILEFGYKFHMNDVAATIGIEQLKGIDQVIQKHRENAAFFDNALTGLNGLTTINGEADKNSAFWLYTLHVQKRLEFMRYLTEAGIAASQVHARNDGHTCFAKAQSDTVPHVDAFVETMCCIPVGWWVSSEDRNYIAEKISEFSHLQLRKSLN